MNVNISNLLWKCNSKSGIFSLFFFFRLFSFSHSPVSVLHTRFTSLVGIMETFACESDDDLPNSYERAPAHCFMYFIWLQLEMNKPVVNCAKAIHEKCSCLSHWHFMRIGLPNSLYVCHLCVRCKEFGKATIVQVHLWISFKPCTLDNWFSSNHIWVGRSIFWSLRYLFFAFFIFNFFFVKNWKCQQAIVCIYMCMCVCVQKKKKRSKEEEETEKNKGKYNSGSYFFRSFIFLFVFVFIQLELSPIQSVWDMIHAFWQTICNH